MYFVMLTFITFATATVSNFKTFKNEKAYSVFFNYSYWPGGVKFMRKH